MDVTQLSVVLVIGLLTSTVDGCEEINNKEARSGSRTFSSHDSYGHDNYTNNQDICWILTARENEVVSVWSDEPLRLEDRSCDDFVELRCGSSNDGIIIGKYCDNDKIRRVYSSSNLMFVRFQSDGSSVANGFEIYYKSVSSSHKASCDHPEGLTGGAIAGIVIGSVAVFLTLLWIYFRCKKIREQNRAAPAQPLTTSAASTSAAASSGAATAPTQAKPKHERRVAPAALAPTATAPSGPLPPASPPPPYYSDPAYPHHHGVYPPPPPPPAYAPPNSSN